MKTIILAAGVGSRLRPITSKKPKCLAMVAGKPILGYQIDAYLNAGIKDIIIVAGYKSGKIKEFCSRIKNANIKIIENKNYENTNNMYSLYLAKEAVDGEDFLLSNGDVVFDPKIAYELVHSKIRDAIACDKGSYNKESMKITVNTSGYVTNISKEIPLSISYGNSIDVYKISSKSSAHIFEEISNIVEKERNTKDWTEVALQRLLNAGRLRIKPFDINGRRWIEIDDMGDLLLADIFFYNIKSLGSKDVFFVDLDGTVYLGDKVIHGAKEFLAKLKVMGKHVYFISNNSSKSKVDYVKKLHSMGIEVSEEDIVLSTEGVIHFLLNEGIKDIFVIGTESMKQEFKRADITVESSNPTYVVLGYDTELTYPTICKAALLLQRGVPLIVTHMDKVCPTPNGPIPDVGSILALFQTATGITPFKVFGKPNPEMILHIIERHNVTPEKIVIIGDRLYTDMKLARHVGCGFICVLSGETQREDIEDVKDYPDLIVKNIGELVDFLK